MSLLKHILNENIDLNEYKRKYTYIENLMNYFESGSIYYSWFKWILFSLKMEKKYTDIVQGSGKHILKHIEIKPIFSKEDAMDYFNETYDRYHILRNNVETIDNVEEVRQYLKKINHKI